MIIFDNTNPLIYLHIFKTAGTSVQKIFWDWYKDENRIYDHSVYTDHFETVKRENCTQNNIDFLKQKGINSPIFFGHFSITKDYTFPESCNQFITMLRDPFNLMVSAFYYSKQRNVKFLPEYDTIEGYILDYNFNYGLTHTFTKEQFTLHNYKELLHKYFVAVGSMKNYKKSLNVFEQTLNKKLKSEQLNIHLNKTNAHYNIPHRLKDLHREIYPLEYAIYDYVNSYYEY